MAILQHKPYEPWEPPTVDVNVTELAIGGKALKIHFRISDYERMRMTSDDEFAREMKRRLARNMVEYMIENRLIEFTSMQSADQMDTIVAARAYLAPDETVKLLRLNKVIP
jgi:hypothetical protein